MRIFLATPPNLEAARDIERHLLSEGHELSSVPLQARHSSSEAIALIKRSDLCVAVIGSTEGHAMFELGFAAGAGVPTLIIATAGIEVPSELAGQRYIAFGGDLGQDLQRLGLMLAELESSGGPLLPSNRRGPHAIGSVMREPQLAETLTGVEFEALAQALFLRLGFQSAASQTPQSGPDLVFQGPAGTMMICNVKRRGAGGLVPGEAVRQVWQYRQDLQASHAVVVSDSGFTRAARELAQELNVLLLTLPDLLAAEGPDVVLGSASDQRPIGTKVGDGDGGSAAVDPGHIGQSPAADPVAQFLAMELALQRALPADAADPHSVRMLLLLEMAEREQRPMSVSALCIASNLTPTTTLRWLSRLEGLGAVERRADADDRRRSMIVIAPETRRIIAQVTQALASGGLASIASLPGTAERGRDPLPLGRPG